MLTSSTTQRDEELLQFLNRVATIDGLGITLSEENVVGDKFSPTDSDKTTCSVRKRSRSKMKTTSISSQSEEIFLQSLGTVCDTRNEGYWTFEWCHREEMKQYHVNSEGKQVNAWSMGKFVGSSKMQDGSFVDLYENGQHCDETNEKRKTSVRFMCCQKFDSNAIRWKIVSIEEPEQCTYSVSVCLKDLCDVRRGRMGPGVNASSSSMTEEQNLPVASKNFDSLLRQMHKQCWVTTLSWWTYVSVTRFLSLSLSISHTKTYTDTKYAFENMCVNIT